MSEDIVARLRDMASDGSHDQLRYEKDKRLASEAADEIARLRTELRMYGDCKTMAAAVEDAKVREIDRLRETVQSREAELLRIRTTQHAAAHELDNIAVEAGLGHSPEAGKVARYVRELREAVLVLANGAGDLSALVNCENWCEAREYGRKCTCGKERDHDAIIDVIKANPIAASAIKAAEEASRR